MKNTFIKTALVIVFCLVAGYGVYYAQNNNKQLTELALANVEALARYELPEVSITCSSGTQGRCFITSNERCSLDYFGLITDYRCKFTGYQEFNCTTLCK